MKTFLLTKLIVGVSEAVQCAEYKEIEGDSMLSRNAAHSGAAM
jgi:hypothetical protein